MSSRVSTPSQDYLTKVGELVFLVGSLEWLVLGELPSRKSVLPPELQIERMAGRSTGQIARDLTNHADAVADQPFRDFLLAAVDPLTEAAERRNHVLHA